MKVFAVAHVDFHENELRVEIIKASSMLDALKRHSAIQKNLNDDGDAELDRLCPDGIVGGGLEQWFFDGDQLVKVVEVPHDVFI